MTTAPNTTLLGNPPCPACAGRGLIDTTLGLTINGRRATSTDSKRCGDCAGTGVRQ